MGFKFAGFALLQTLLLLVSMTIVKAKAGLTVPKHAWDSHIHVIESDKFPLSPDRDYTPKAATREQALAFERSVGIQHAVIVLPSVYGTNNSVLIDALRSTNGTYRGVCVLDLSAKIDNNTLQTFHDAGVRGIRINYGNEGTDAQITADTIRAASIAQIHDWTLQLWVPIASFKSLHPIIPTLGVRVVADHYAHAMTASRTGNLHNAIDPFSIPGFREVVDLMRRNHLFVKISAPYQNSRDKPLYSDLRVIAETFMLHGPDMVVFGSDWPHTASKEGNGAGGRLVEQDFRDVDDQAILQQTLEWAGTQAQVRRLFVDNPRRLWGWTDMES
ncbi:amidohydrolase family protein [Aspergillus tubingensis]|uniref:amidohydrolase family protein n=1 Tax=Aspergillus tubingensis TaxID=5068 RepID=UPI001578F11F|nr:amidohydrolase family protein [Aspergillus tubingensis]GFN19527.1 amidohydrolase family protein [Aspergillus tubingensis]